MNNKILLVLVLMAVLTFSTINFAQAVPPTPPAPNAGIDLPTPPAPNVGNETQPFKERLEAFYTAKENFINQKRKCKESVVATNAPPGYLLEQT